MVAQQTLTLNTVVLTGPAPVSGTACNGNYNGTFQGNVTVSAGQNCSYLSGGINGNANVQGGSLALNGAKVTGNVAVQGNSTFSLGTGTTISGNLSITSIASGTAVNRVCGSSVGTNLAVSGNATPVAIGLPDSSCLGNSFGNNATLENNTAVQFFGNRVDKNLACSGNISITGGSNSAQRKLGQCVAF